MPQGKICQKFKEPLGKLKEKLSHLAVLLEQYKETGSEATVRQIEEEKAQLAVLIENFKKEEITELIEKKKELLEKWYERTTRGRKGSVQNFLNQVEFDEKGKAIINGVLFLFNLGLFSSSFYLPKVIGKIEGLDCSHNRLTQLPELPESLERLFCFNNRLTQLPELPENLKELYCSGNPLTQEAIAKIKAHPRYDPKTWGI